MGEPTTKEGRVWKARAEWMSEQAKRALDIVTKLFEPGVITDAKEREAARIEVIEALNRATQQPPRLLEEQRKRVQGLKEALELADLHRRQAAQALAEEVRNRESKVRAKIEEALKNACAISIGGDRCKTHDHCSFTAVLQACQRQTKELESEIARRKEDMAAARRCAESDALLKDSLRKDMRVAVELAHVRLESLKECRVRIHELEDRAKVLEARAAAAGWGCIDKGATLPIVGGRIYPHFGDAPPTHPVPVPATEHPRCYPRLNVEGGPTQCGLHHDCTLTGMLVERG